MIPKESSPGYISDDIVNALRVEWGLDVISASKIDSLDFASGLDDPLLLGILESQSSNLDEKLEVLDRLSCELLEHNKDKRLDQTRVGNFITTAASLYTKDTTPYNLKEALYDYFDPSVLERIALESSVYRWDEKSTEAALHGYCTFLTVDRLFGEIEGGKLYRQIAETLVLARELDIYLGRVANRVSNEERGTTIYLGARGAEMAQVVAQLAYKKTCKEMKALGVIAPYYRDHVLTTNFGSESDDPSHHLATIDQTIAEIARVEGGSGGGGKDLPTKGEIIGTDGQIGVLRSTANVGGHIVAASGYADKLRLETIRKKGIVYNQPERANAYRDIQLDNTETSVLISLGDGAFLHLNDALEFQANNRLPVINLIQNNEVAIGTAQNEVVFQTELWQRGHGRGIPGIRIKKLEPDKLFMAMRFATLRALRDAGPTIVEAMVTRLLPHSIQHGDHITAGYIKRAKELIELEINEGVSEDKKIELENYVNRTLIKPSRDDDQIKLTDRLKALLKSNFIMNETIKKDIQVIIDEIVDPVGHCLNVWKEKGYITFEEIEKWNKKASRNIDAVVEEVLKRERPKPDKATQNIRIPTPSTIEFSYSGEKITLDGISEALRLAQIEAMQENSNVSILGTDVVKGFGIEGKEFIEEGGYFKQQKGLFELFGHLPRRITNMPIHELSVAKYLFGMAITPTDSKSLQSAMRILYDAQYADYALEAWAAAHIQGNRYYSTDGKITTLIGLLFHSGAVAGGGFMHSHEVAAKVYQMNPSVDIFYPSDPETTYKLLHYCLLHENNPYMFMTDKTKMFNFPKTFEKGTGFFEPGHGRVAKPGKETQVISFGPMLNKIFSAVERLEDQRLKENIGIFDIVSLRPFPYDDLWNFLSEGNGPIFVAHEELSGNKVGKPTGRSYQEPITQGFGAQVVHLLATDPEFYKLVKNRLPIIQIGSKPVTAPPCDGNLLKAVIPTTEDIQRFIMENHNKFSYPSPVDIFLEEVLRKRL